MSPEVHPGMHHRVIHPGMHRRVIHPGMPPSTVHRVCHPVLYHPGMHHRIYTRVCTTVYTPWYAPPYIHPGIHHPTHPGYTSLSHPSPSSVMDHGATSARRRRGPGLKIERMRRVEASFLPKSVKSVKKGMPPCAELLRSSRRFNRIDRIATGQPSVNPHINR